MDDPMLEQVFDDTLRFVKKDPDAFKKELNQPGPFAKAFIESLTENLGKEDKMSDVLIELPKKVALHYEKCGDGLGAGIHYAYLVDKKCWYASVHRFPTKSIASRMIVAKATHETLATCFELLETNWNTIVKALADLETARLGTPTTDADGREP